MADTIATLRPAPASGAPPTPSDALPGWLQRLATESWQVELLISGFAIVGTAQLTDLLEPLAGYALFSFRDDVLEFVSFAHLYLTLGFVLLPVLFAVHFAVRAFWVGMVGLASVYPDGIGPERSSLAPEAYVEEVRAKYPPLSVWIARTESVASLMFVVAALIAMVFVGTAVAVVGFALVAYAIEVLSGGLVPFRLTATVLLALIMGLAALTMALQSSRLRHRPWAQRIHLRLQSVMQALLYHVFLHPVVYLTTVLATNIKVRSPVLAPVGIALVTVLGFFLYDRGHLAAALMNTERLREEAALVDYRDPARYRSEWPREGYVALLPYVERERVAAGELLEVAVPVLGEDRARIVASTPAEPASVTDTTRAVRRALRRERALRSHRGYYRFRLDTLVLPAEDLLRYEGSGRERGVRALVRLPPNPPAGRQTLWVDRRGATGVGFEPLAAIPLILGD